MGKDNVDGEEQFLININQLVKEDGVNLILTGMSPSWFNDDSWSRWWKKLPKPNIDNYLLRFSRGANRTKALLDEAKAGLLFVDISQYGPILRVRELLLNGHHMQPLPDRGAFVWSLFDCGKHVEHFIDKCLEQLDDLVAPKDIGRYLEACELLNKQPFDDWGFYEYYRIAYSYFVEKGEVTDWDPSDKVPNINQLQKAISDLDTVQTKLLQENPKVNFDSLDEIFDPIGSPDTLDLRQKQHQSLKTFR